METPATIALAAEQNLDRASFLNSDKSNATEARRNYQNRINEITNDFEKNLSEFYGTGNTAADHIIYGKAWDDGHSSGYSEVENLYQDLVHFAESLKEAFSK